MAAETKAAKLRGEGMLSRMQAMDDDEQVVITRDLSEPDDAADWNPLLSVTITPRKSPLHPHDIPPKAVYLEYVRADELRKITRTLTLAIETAEVHGIIPPEMSDAEWQDRLDEAQGHATARKP